MKIIKLFFISCTIFTISSASDINIDALTKQAKKSHKLVLVFLHKPRCSYCESMTLFTLADDDIAEKIKKSFIFVDIDIADTGKIIFDGFKGNRQEFAKSLGFNFYPSSVFIDGENEVVYGQAGYKDEEKYLKILRFVESYSYKEMHIDEFK